VPRQCSDCIRRGTVRKRRAGPQSPLTAEAGPTDVSTQDVLSRFIAALGGTLKLIADFGDERSG